MSLRMSSDPWKRFRERQVEQKPAQRGQTQPSPSGGSSARGPGQPVSGSLPGESDLESLTRQIEPLLEQLNTLYQMFFQGLEKRPPLEKRALLDRLLVQLGDLNKTSPSARFKSQSVITSALTRIELWERKLKAMEKAA